MALDLAQLLGRSGRRRPGPAQLGLQGLGAGPQTLGFFGGRVELGTSLFYLSCQALDRASVVLDLSGQPVVVEAGLA